MHGNTSGTDLTNSITQNVNLSIPYSLGLISATRKNLFFIWLLSPCKIVKLKVIALNCRSHITARKVLKHVPAIYAEKYKTSPKTIIIILFYENLIFDRSSWWGNSTHKRKSERQVTAAHSW